jgi:hypothetical protein
VRRDSDGSSRRPRHPRESNPEWEIEVLASNRLCCQEFSAAARPAKGGLSGSRQEETKGPSGGSIGEKDLKKGTVEQRGRRGLFIQLSDGFLIDLASLL